MLPAEPVAVRFSEGALHGLVALRDLDGTLLADGDAIQTVRGDRITARLVFRFKDGSIHEETTVYSQRGRFRLISDHLVQKGPTFPTPLEMSIDGITGRVTVTYEDEGDARKSAAERFDVPADLANGMVAQLLMNARPGAMPKTLSLIAATPAPRLVSLAITAAGSDPFLLGGATRQAAHYVLKVELGGVAGLVAPLLGKQPPDAHVWILNGDAPAFLKAELPFYAGGPAWRIELAGPVWPKRTSVAQRQDQ